MNQEGRTKTGITMDVLREVLRERQSQDAKWGMQNHNPEKWVVILGEEFGETCLAILDKRAHPNEYRQELIQVAAVAVAAIECFDRYHEGKTFDAD